MLDVQAHRGIQCGSDHYLIKAKIIFPYNIHTQRTDRNHTMETGMH
jgi:hypothetical protein